MTYPQIVDLFQYKWGLTCLADATSNQFCSDVENTWNITTMVANQKATWPVNPPKTYYDISSGSWDPYTDLNGTLASPYDYDIWLNASAVGSTGQMTGLDYYVQRPLPSDDSNYGWTAPLDADEYPLEIQCSSCFTQRFLYGMGSRWGDVWDEISTQVWGNMQQNCNLTSMPIVANNLTGKAVGLVDDSLPPLNFSACANPLTVANTTCSAVGVQYSVPSASIPALNYLQCGLVNGQICAPLSCPITVNNQTQSVRPFVASYNNFTLVQFLIWNPYINPVAITENETVCVGPPGGVYSPPAATPAYPTIYTTTATPTEPTPSGTVPNCGLYYGVQPGDSCNTVALNFSITLTELLGIYQSMTVLLSSLTLLDLNPSLNTDCTNLNYGYDYCVAPVNGTTVSPRPTTTSTTIAPAGSTTVPAPGPTVSGTTANCRQWYIVKSGDTCYAIETTYGITSTQFLGWNTGVNSGCTNLYVGDAYCVAGP